MIEERLPRAHDADIILPAKPGHSGRMGMLVGQPKEVRLGGEAQATEVELVGGDEVARGTLDEEPVVGQMIE